MSGDLSDDDMNRVLALIAEYKAEGINIDLYIAIKYVNNPDGIRRDLIAEKPVIDNTLEMLTEKHNKQADRVVRMLPNNSADKDFEGKVLRIVSQNNGTDKELANMCFLQLFLDKSNLATAKPANNNCVAAGGSSTENSGWRCTNCTYENPQNVEVCEICDEPKTLEEEEEDDQQLTDTEMQLLNATNLRTRLRELGVDIDSIEDLIPFVIQHKDSSLEEMVDIYISTHSNVEVRSEPVRNAISSNKNVEWECTSCTFFNKENDDVCIICETNRENDIWTCICSTKNSIMLNICRVCENTKE
jgi:hypothetical protein